MKSIWVTEAGWPAENQYGIGEAEQANSLRQIVDYLRDKEASMNIRSLVWYNFRDTGNPLSDWHNWCGLRANDGHFRQAWTAFQEKAGVPQFVPQVPAVSTSEASEIGVSSAKLGGTVNPQGLITTYHFEYGTTTNYGQVSPSPDGTVGEGRSGVAVSAMIKGLEARTTYHYRLVASNLIGVSRGEDRTFTTSPIVVAYQGAEGGLWTSWLPSAAGDRHLGMGAAGSKPSVAALANGNYEVAFRSDGNELWTYSPSAGATNLKLGMMPGSTPGIAALPAGGYVITFQSNEGELWAYSSTSGAVPLHLGMGITPSSPSIAAQPNGSYVIAFRAYGNGLWLYSPEMGGVDLNQSMLAGASPSVTVLPNGLAQVAFQSSSGELRTYSPSYGVSNLGLGMGTEPSTPSITATANGGYQIAFKAYGEELWTYSTTTGATSTGLAIKAGSSPSISG